MVYGQFQLQKMLEKDTLTLGKLHILQNGSKECGICLYVRRPALIVWLQEYLQDPNPIITGGKLDEFDERYFKRFRLMVVEVLKGLISHYGAFPSPQFPTENVAFIFDDSNSMASSKKISEDFMTIRIGVNIRYLEMNDAQMLEFIKHEMFHIIAEVKEGQKRLIERIKVLQRRFSGDISKDRKLLDSSVQHVLEYCREKSFNAKDFEEQINISVGYFYNYYAERFWNLVSDSALCVIAMELKDMSFIYTWVQSDKYIVVELGGRLEKLDGLMEHIIGNEPDKIRKEMLKAALKVIQFIDCFNGMPFFAIAYGILGEAWEERIPAGKTLVERFKKVLGRVHTTVNMNESGRNISTFKTYVKKYCDPEVAARFLKFYDSYLEIIKAQSIDNNLLDLNIIKQIHDTGAIQRSEEAYTILNREFGGLFSKLRRLE